MTEMVEGTARSSDTSSSIPVNSASTPSHVNSATSEERYFTQSEVNGLIAQTKRETREREARLREQQPEYYQQKHPEVTHKEKENVDIDKRINEAVANTLNEYARQHEEKQKDIYVSQIAEQFVKKMQTGKEKYSDFDQVTDGLDYSKYPNVVHLANGNFDNTVDIFYQLAKNPEKMAVIELAARTPGFRDEATRILAEVSRSIKDNEAADKIKVPNTPLSQLSPSSTGMDSGVLSVRDYRKKYRV